MADPKFRIGNLDRLLVLPVPSEPVNAAPVRSGATLTGLSGRRTLQTFGMSRSWEFTFRGVTPDELAEIESIYQGNIEAPYYMFDPMRKNLLPAELASARSIQLGKGYTPSGTVQQNTVMWSTDRTNHPVPQSTSVVQVNTGTNPVVYMRKDTARTEPIISGLTYTYSHYVNHIATPGTVEAFWIWRDKDGVNIGNTAASGGGFNLGAGWHRHTITGTAPAGACYVQTGVWANQNNLFQMGPAQLEIGSSATSWVPGYGTPMVAIESFEASYPRFGLVEVQLTIVET